MFRSFRSYSKYSTRIAILSSIDENTNNFNKIFEYRRKLYSISSNVVSISSNFAIIFTIAFGMSSKVIVFSIIVLFLVIDIYKRYVFYQILKWCKETKKAYDLNHYDFSCTPCYLFLSRRSALAVINYLTSSKINYIDSQ